MTTVKLPPGGILSLFTDRLAHVGHVLIKHDLYEAAQVVFTACKKMQQGESQLAALMAENAQLKQKIMKEPDVMQAWKGKHDGK